MGLVQLGKSGGVEGGVSRARRVRAVRVVRGVCGAAAR